ncbi:DUF4349 domain-containing protein [Candidatus Roizmanbacteria bacterium]|nr:DUF4349 domain-containing protein [Candidatus Roizmanbacteria bacterium]
MGRLLNWIKTHKLTSLLLIIVAYFVYSQFFGGLTRRTALYESADSGVAMKSAPGSLNFDIPRIGGIAPSYDEAAPAPDVKNRLVVQESYLSLLVNNVTEVREQIIQKADQLGGYMVNSNLNNPQDAPTATVTVRVPSTKLQEGLQAFRGLAVKVISENLSGQDVTDEYVDNEARLATLEKTKKKFEEILDKATNVQDILTVQREIITLQSQIDSVKGQQNYLEKNAQMAKLTLYLSTDELALPYAPSEAWRPEVIFKQAVRSLIGNLRKLGTFVIWLAVYSVILIPVFLVAYFLRKRRVV